MILINQLEALDIGIRNRHPTTGAQFTSTLGEKPSLHIGSNSNQNRFLFATLKRISFYYSSYWRVDAHHNSLRKLWRGANELNTWFITQYRKRAFRNIDIVWHCFTIWIPIGCPNKRWNRTTILTLLEDTLCHLLYGQDDCISFLEPDNVLGFNLSFFHFLMPLHDDDESFHNSSLVIIKKKIQCGTALAFQSKYVNFLFRGK